MADTEPKKRVRRTKEEAQRVILDAAEERLANGGPEALRLQDIAADVGISHPAILHHFGVLGILPPNTAKTAEVPVFTGLQATINFNLAQVSVSSSAFGSKNEQKQATIDSHCR